MHLVGVLEEVFQLVGRGRVDGDLQDLYAVNFHDVRLGRVLPVVGRSVDRTAVRLGTTVAPAAHIVVLGLVDGLIAGLAIASGVLAGPSVLGTIAGLSVGIGIRLPVPVSARLPIGIRLPIGTRL
ncbi:hypothetical protein ABZ912_04915, partial [Nonomuraea angiospora]|uniref:hypothetical protein n=1 Tax=Nonomuraea angiospora TaxID=46172 RepID=UPI00340509D4